MLIELRLRVSLGAAAAGQFTVTLNHFRQQDVPVARTAAAGPYWRLA